MVYHAFIMVYHALAIVFHTEHSHSTMVNNAPQAVFLNHALTMLLIFIYNCGVIYTNHGLTMVSHGYSTMVKHG